MILCFLNIISCKSLKDAQVQSNFNPTIYRLLSKIDKSVLLYFHNYKIEKSNKILSVDRTINISNGELIKFKPYVCVIPLRNEFEITEFSVIYLDYDIDKKISFKINDNSIILDTNFTDENGFLIVPNTLQNSDSYEFGVYTIKIDTNNLQRYFPSSERLRIELLDKKVKLVWNSNYNQNYLAVVGELNSKQIGEINYYKILWNKKDLNKNKIEPNEYIINYILPLQPRNIKIMKTIYLE